MSKKPQPTTADMSQLEQHIVRLEKMRRDFIANVSHELRTPLTVIQGYLETLLEADDINRGALKKIITQMHQHSTRMSDIISDLLLLSNLEYQENIPASTSLLSLKTICKQLRPEIDSINDSLKAEHNIIFNLADNTEIHGDEHEIKSLIINLVTNAIKYTHPPGEIKIIAYKTNENIVFEVVDNGIGIDSKYLERLTERFYRVDKARSRDCGGTGLGLSIVKHILIHHAGSLVIESTPGQGSTFRCLFPLI